MQSPDGVRLRHMHDAVADAVRIVSGRSLEDLFADSMVAFAVIRCLEVLGEAASKLTPETIARFPEIPFAKMISMRNRLIHAYFDVNLSIVWSTVTEDLLPLLPALEKAIEAVEKE